MRTIVLGATLAALAGCAPPVPEAPTWFHDVQPIIKANCARCHGPDPKEPQIGSFRLDRYVSQDEQTSDAWDFRAEIIDHAVSLEAPPMPPDFPLSERQRAILERWEQQGAVKGTRDNAPPRAELVVPAPGEVPASVDQSLDLSVRSWDDDADGLWVQLFAREVGGVEEVPLAPRSGQGLHGITADFGVLPSGRTYEVFAALDDGFSDDPAENRTEVTLIDALLVDHGAKGTAPAVRLLEPNGGATLFGDVTIAWTAADPDPGDTLSVALDLYRLDISVWTLVETIASGLPVTRQSHVWTPDVPASTPSGAPIAYRMRVTARDAAGNTRLDESDMAFSLAPPPRSTTLTWEDVKPFFHTYCHHCHGQPADLQSLEYFRLDKYDAADPESPANSDLGVYEMVGDVYQKLLVSETMPPAREPQPQEAEKARIQEWLLGGAPSGGGPTDAPPVITWSTPNDSAVSPTSGGSITLSWSASDPEGNPVTGPVSWTRIMARTDALATCSASLTGWTALPGVDVSAGTAPFTRPACSPTPGNTCYWCFKAEASDGAKTTTRVAIKPVK